MQNVGDTYAEEIPQHEGACSVLEGHDLKGKKGGQWKVIEKLKIKKNSTGGTFSVGYIVENSDGHQAFMKATDVQMLGRSGNLFEALERATVQQKFERDILDFCRGSNLDKIVHAVDYGEFDIVYQGVREVVFFIIFERADGDARSVINPEKKYDFLWALAAMHNLSIAVQQLHNKSIAHNDIKPSNLLVFQSTNQKLGDLGRATSELLNSPFEDYPHPGDMRYAAPEQLYRHHKRAKPTLEGRKASDMYLLGSMIVFFVTGVHTTLAVQNVLGNHYHSINWHGTFDEVLPFWRDGFGSVMLGFEAQLPSPVNENIAKANKDLIAAVRHLCEPDPTFRGYPHSGQKENPYSVERFITLFDRLKKQYEVHLK